MRRLLIHAGFHKTGTSSIQTALDTNRDVLAPALSIRLKSDILPLTEAARAWSRTRDDVEWVLFLNAAHQVLADLPPEDPRPIVISSEDLSGHMPFRHDLVDYRAAPRLLAGLIQVAAQVQPDVQCAALFTTRAPRAWVDSCYAQHVRATRMTEDRETYAARALPHADLDAMVDRIAAAVAPVPVHRAALERLADAPLGPVSAILDWAGVPDALRRAMAPAKRANAAMPPQVLSDLLAANRSDAPSDRLKAEKKAPIRKAKRARR